MVVSEVAQNSIADELGIAPGDELLSINGRIIRDIIDYDYYMPEEELVLLFRSPSGEYEAEIEKEPYEDIGLSFSNEFGRKIVCRNNCLFCFVDQQPKNMRKTLHVKDDDWRMSFLQGSYITLTNLSEEEIERIIEQKISPLYLSVHASDNEVRRKLFQCEAAAGTFAILRRLVENGITVHAQVVMCPGINDGNVLKKTIADLYGLYPGVKSLAVVPVGLTRYRDGLYPLEPVGRDTASETIDMIERFQQKALKESETRFVFASDEMYIRACTELPAYDEYEDFDQIENGVGLVAKFLNEAEEAIAKYGRPKKQCKSFAVATGVDFYPYMRRLAEKITAATGITVNVYRIANDFFGASVTVTGLLTGKDVINALKGIKEDVLLLSSSCFMENSDIMLDDISLDELQKELGLACRIVRPNGSAFVKEIVA